MTAEKSDHDLLVEIQTDLKWFRDSYVKHCEDKAANLAILDNKISKAHTRIDALQFSGILALIILALSIWFK